MGIKEIFDTAANSERFKINDCIDVEPALSVESSSLLRSISQKFTTAEYKAFKQSIIRNSFFIEPVNDAITSTKFETRWNPHLRDDVRFASFDTCYSIFLKLLNSINNLSNEDFLIFKEFFNSTVIPYEMPIDYIDRLANPIHVSNNVDLFLNDDIKKCISVRKLLRNQTTNPAAAVFQTILTDKIKVKTYLTDRALTGAYKTNREKRWETHPSSVQYALRRDCMKIETKLLLQVATFEGCPRDLVNNLQSQGLLPSNFTYCKCPVTGDIIKYEEFENDVLHPTHGKSKFQVGHLNPLKAQGMGNETSGHTVDNISWISEDGNRIQGSLSIHEVNNMLKRIYINRPELHP